MGNIVYHRKRTGCITDLIVRMHCMGVGVYGQGIASQSSQNGDCSNGMMYEVGCHKYNLQKHDITRLPV